MGSGVRLCLHDGYFKNSNTFLGCAGESRAPHRIRDPFVLVNLHLKFPTTKEEIWEAEKGLPFGRNGTSRVGMRRGSYVFHVLATFWRWGQPVRYLHKQRLAMFGGNFPSCGVHKKNHLLV